MISTVVACHFASGADDQPQIVVPLEQWSHVFKSENDEKLKDAAPSKGYIDNADDWKKLWKTWKPDADLPKVDFTSEIILVGTSSGPNRMNLRASLDKQGNLKAVGMQTLIGGPGFGYHMLRVKRDGIKSINGKPLK